MKIALLGHGIVGSGVRRIIEEKDLKNIEIVSILVKDESEKKDERFTTNVDDILNDEQINTVIECMGGDEPAHTFVLRALENKKNVISANKKMLARHLDLFKVARNNKVKLLVEASCGGGIPWFSNIRKIRRNDDIESFEGIMNGTCNYILSKMFNEDKAYDEVLKEAQELGYAEADPTDDVDGYDTLFKTVLSIYQAFDEIADPNEIPVFGIRNLSPDALKIIKEKGYTIKLIGKAKKTDKGIQAYAMPQLLKRDSVFANVNSNLNILSTTSMYLGTASFIGQGAGSLPTGHAIVQDLEDLLDKDFEKKRRKKVAKLNNDIYGKWFIVHKDISGFNKYIDEQLADDVIITEYCCLKDIQKILNKNEDDSFFIAEVEND